MKIRADIDGKEVSGANRAFVNPGEIESVKVELMKLRPTSGGKLVINVD